MTAPPVFSRCALLRMNAMAAMLERSPSVLLRCFALELYGSPDRCAERHPASPERASPDIALSSRLSPADLSSVQAFYQVRPNYPGRFHRRQWSWPEQ